jgi:hypothetical protein
LDEYAWKNRPILVFAPSAEEPAYRTQVRLLIDNAAGCEERDIVLFLLPVEGRRTVDGTPVSHGASDLLWKQFRVPVDRFAILLVGKDGGVKLRSEEPVSADEIFRLIDRMPLRRREMQRWVDARTQ